MNNLIICIQKPQKQYQTIMNKSELLEKIREKNEELDSLNKELKEITAEENATNLGKCFKKDIGVGAFYYCKVIQILPKNHDTYKILTVFGEEISIDYWTSLEDFEADLCSSEEFDTIYNKVINESLANKVIY